MRTPDADIPPALQGKLTAIVADIGGIYVCIRHPLEDGGLTDPQLHAVPVTLRLRGISEHAADRIAILLEAIPGNARLPSRADVLRLLSDTLIS